MKSESPEKQLISKIKSVNNILLTVSRNPNVDQLVSTLGLTIALNKLGKRSVAVFSGKIPPAIKFLRPEKTFENNADSLRDFIISLSKDKADRLKVRPDGDFVKVYITPYRTKITPGDLKFEEGDFNIELIIALGVSNRDELDASIASHGKIFHNAVTATLNLGQIHDALGMISWQDDRSGCYAEMCYQLINDLDSERPLIDEAVATALLTGVVSATDQFRNKSTTPAIMTLSANLMAQGADQQLITSELESADNTVTEAPTPRDDANEYTAIDFNRSGDGSQTGDTAEQSYDIDNSSRRDSEQIENRLRQDREDLGQRRTLDALQATQARLLETEGSIYGAGNQPGKPLPPEAPRVNDPAPKPAPAPRPLSPAPEPKPVPPTLGPKPAPAPKPSPQPEAPLPPSPAPKPAPAPGPIETPIPPAPAASTLPPLREGQSGQYIGDPMADVRPQPIAPAPQPANVPASMMPSYLMNDDQHAASTGVQNGNDVSTANATDDLPFRQPNQVSPIVNQPSGPAPAAMPTLDNPVLVAPDAPLMPPAPKPAPAPAPGPIETPIPPAPVTTPDLASMPPAPSTAMQTTSTIGVSPDMSLPLPPPVPPMPTDGASLPPIPPAQAPEPTPSANQSLAQPAPQPSNTLHDPSQFVIPS